MGVVLPLDPAPKETPSGVSETAPGATRSEIFIGNIRLQRDTEAGNRFAEGFYNSTRHTLRFIPTAGGEVVVQPMVEMIRAGSRRGGWAVLPCKVDVEYEWMPSECDKCRSLGHDQTKCPWTKVHGQRPINVNIAKQNLPQPRRQDDRASTSMPSQQPGVSSANVAEGGPGRHVTDPEWRSPIRRSPPYGN
ncbi:hypothetical protein Salat_1720600 [Sesamum alatum]|uniref:Uncharacterized protein n=1 Tax=Sesamum alatum TaxID=300844 RepID=A0AAE2CK97_9LAMI|nr:hypothetical protein Salat_1720600 [Sesamum alatum]